MKKYIKPTVNVINLKSSNDIAASFDNLRATFVRNYLTGKNSAAEGYTVSVYSNTLSTGDADLTNVEG